MRKLTLAEFKALPFGTNIIIHIKIPYYGRDEKYNAVIVRDKLYYEDGKSDDRYTIEEYMYNDCTDVYLR